MKKTVFNKMDKKVNEVYGQVEQYNEKIFKPVEKEYNELVSELETLKNTPNVITPDGGVDAYFKRQERLKVLPELIADANNRRVEALAQKDPFMDSLYLSVYNELGDDFKAEYNNNVDELLTEFNDAVSKMISVYHKMLTLDREYNELTNDMQYVRGIYMTLDSNLKVNPCLAEHNIYKLNLSTSK